MSYTAYGDIVKCTRAIDDQSAFCESDATHEVVTTLQTGSTIRTQVCHPHAVVSVAERVLEYPDCETVVHLL